MKNFRDLGGKQTIDGRTVRYGLFFRSAHLYNLDDNDIKILKKLKIKNIFDYRSDDEAKKNPSTIIEDINNIRITAMDIQNENKAKFGSAGEMTEALFKNDLAFTLLKDNYYSLPVGNDSYKALVKLVRNPEMLPILNHCTAGKDRTGVGCAIIYMILGVPREEIVKDYLKSNDYAMESITEFIKNKPELQNVPTDKLKYIFGVNEEYINNAFKRIDEEYKNEEDYLYYEFNLYKEEIEKLRSIYLE